MMVEFSSPTTSSVEVYDRLGPVHMHRLLDVEDRMRAIELALKMTLMDQRWKQFKRWILEDEAINGNMGLLCDQSRTSVKQEALKVAGDWEQTASGRRALWVENV